ncbi:MAG TPA: hypothetical protein VFN32_09275 [Rhodococcus sp. (in: high G+C Gram-positive bacteria)]|jgi:hypothetical protein|nr:hypothetical protein [Rhodococcus sp. (in: high G+C Gram-positive bacteria)]
MSVHYVGDITADGVDIRHALIMRFADIAPERVLAGRAGRRRRRTSDLPSRRPPASALV